MTELRVDVETWPIAGSFTISRGSRREARVVTAKLLDNSGFMGCGECVPYARYGETVEGVVASLEALSAEISRGATRLDIQELMPQGAARNALDCAFWDLEAKRAKRRAWELAGSPAPLAVVTAYTLSLGTPRAMEEAARRAEHRPLLKVKLGAAEGDEDRIAAVRRGAPNSVLIVDANEGWHEENLLRHFAACHAAKVQLIEQPLPSKDDEILLDLSAGLRCDIPICADESFHGMADLGGIARKYQAINIKLDKTGGLTAAIGVLVAAKDHNLKIMIGCMLGTSLAMAPALLLTSDADFVDLDGPLLLERDRNPGLEFKGSVIEPFSSALWG